MPRQDLDKVKDISQNRLFMYIPGAKDILNLGASDGNFIDKYPWKEYNIINLDNNSEDNEFQNYLDKNKKYDKINIKNMKGDCRDLSMFKENSFDMVVFTHLIEHLDEDDIHKTLKEIKRVLKNHGILVTSTPNKTIRKFFGNYKKNPYHKEEFTYGEFYRYIAKYFKILKEFGALWIDIHSRMLKANKIDDPQNSYVMMFIAQNEK